MYETFILKSKGKEINIVPKCGDMAAILGDFKASFEENRKFFESVPRINILWDKTADYSFLAELQKSGIYIDVVKTSPFDIAELKNAPKTVKKIVRSGDKIEHDGDIIIDGDVNQGGEVIASGNIYIIGELRGIAHSGYLGDTTRSVFALHYDNCQVRIGTYAKYFKKGRFSKNKPDVKFSLQGEDIVISNL